MLEALIGGVVVLIGVALGGLVNVAVQTHLAQLERARSQRVAARVVHGELVPIESKATIAEAQDRDPVTAIEPTRLLEAWDQHRVALADLPDDEWYAVQTAVYIVVMDAQRPIGLRKFLPVITKARVALDEYTRRPEPATIRSRVIAALRAPSTGWRRRRRSGSR